MVTALKKGIVLAGGSGTRLYPMTEVVCKHLLPVYDKPMVYYPISTLMMLGITDILIISTPKDLPHFESLFGDGGHLGLRISYEVQPEPKGIAQALIIGEEFISDGPVALILGDNIFYGNYDFLRRARDFAGGATLFGYYVKNPARYGVVEFDHEGKAVSIEEKPTHPKSNYAVTGLYLYDASAASIARSLDYSERGELEITDINKAYLDRGELSVVRLGRGITWLDTGTRESLLEASKFISVIENRQGLKIACLEEIAFRMELISRDQLASLADRMAANSYRDYLQIVIKEADGEWR